MHEAFQAIPPKRKNGRQNVIPVSRYDQTIVKKRARILYVDGNILYAQIGNRLCTSDDNGISWRKYSVRLFDGACAYSKMHARITRRGVHCLRVLRDGNLLLVAKQAIYVYDHGKGNVVKSFSIPRGSRPLFIGENQNGDLFWGEYYGNSKRGEVNIYMSSDHAWSWKVVYKFKKNSIRHVHGVFYDPYDERIWVTTGDEDHESAIWATDDKFKTFEKVIGGNQQSRALQLLFTKDYAYFGTDTPFEINHIYRLHKGSGSAERLVPIDSSVYWGCKVDDALFFSTALEFSSVNVCSFASMWGSLDGRSWRQVAKYKKDLWRTKYCEIGQVYFPQGNNTTGYLFYTPVATECDQTLQRIRVADLF